MDTLIIILFYAWAILGFVAFATISDFDVKVNFKTMLFSIVCGPFSVLLFSVYTFFRVLATLRDSRFKDWLNK